jgi:hypothetical protein
LTGADDTHARRRRLANARPARPRPKRERLIGSGKLTLGPVKSLEIEFSSESSDVMEEVFNTLTLLTPGLKVIIAVPLFSIAVGVRRLPFIMLVEFTLGDETSIPTVPSPIVWVVEVSVTV